MSLLDQSLWWLIPYILLMLLMLQAMMEFTVSLLVQRPQAKRRPLPAQELEQRLLALSQDAHPYRLVAGQDCDLEIVWEPVETTAAERTRYAKSASRSHIRLLFDETRHDLRVNQVSRSYFFLIGMVGWLPRL